MSKLKINVSTIEEIKPHPNANKMELIRTKGWWCCTGIGNFKVGDPVIHFPPETLLPEIWAKKYGITKTCEEVIQNNKKYYKISVPKLRGIRSFGFCIKPDFPYQIGDDVTQYFNAVKYETPFISKKYKIKSIPNLFKYNDIEQLQNVPDMFKPYDEVTVSEKIHGQNFVVGVLRDYVSNKMVYVASSHRLRVPIECEYEIQLFNYINLKYKYEYNNRKSFLNRLLKNVNDIFYPSIYKIKNITEGTNLYSIPFNSFYVRCAMNTLSNNIDNILPEYVLPKDSFNDVLIYGEVYGNGVQDMSYGLDSNIDFKTFNLIIDGFRMNNPYFKDMTYGMNDKDFRIFDIRINGIMLKYDDFKNICFRCGIFDSMINELYRGPFKDAMLDNLVSGPTTMCDINLIKEPFKGKEGLVIKSVSESFYNGHDRKIAKYINPEYLTRSNPNKTEYH